MNTNITGRTLLLSLVVGVLPAAVACGSAATEGDVGTSAQAATLADDGVTPVSASADPGAAEHTGRHGRGAWFRRFDADGDGRIKVADLPERLREHLGAADANHDGFITKEEMHAARAAEFAKMKAEMDTNHDGTVSADERKAAGVRFMEAHLMKRDANGDHALTEDEVGAKKWNSVKQADTNGDGRVTSDEIAAAVESGVLGRFHHGKDCDGDHAPKTSAETTVL